MKFGMIILLVILLLSLFLVSCTQNRVECETLEENTCLEHQDVCELCGETKLSSYASCHSKEFCQNAPFE